MTILPSKADCTLFLRFWIPEAEADADADADAEVEVEAGLAEAAVVAGPAVDTVAGRGRGAPAGGFVSVMVGSLICKIRSMLPFGFGSPLPRHYVSRQVH